MGAVVAEVDFDALKVGDKLPPVDFGPVSRHALALYCGGSGDHNPIHVDSDFAKSAGYDDVFAHGMFSMALLGRMLTNWTDQENIRSFGVRFSAITHVHDEITASATIKDEMEEAGERRFVLDVETCTQNGVQTLRGEAVIAVAKTKSQKER